MGSRQRQRACRGAGARGWQCAHTHTRAHASAARRFDARFSRGGRRPSQHSKPIHAPLTAPQQQPLPFPPRRRQGGRRRARAPAGLPVRRPRGGDARAPASRRRRRVRAPRRALRGAGVARGARQGAVRAGGSWGGGRGGGLLVFDIYSGQLVRSADNPPPLPSPPSIHLHPNHRPNQRRRLLGRLAAAAVGARRRAQQQHHCLGRCARARARRARGVRARLRPPRQGRQGDGAQRGAALLRALPRARAARRGGGVFDRRRCCSGCAAAVAVIRRKAVGRRQRRQRQRRRRRRQWAGRAPGAFGRPRRVAARRVLQGARHHARPREQRRPWQRRRRQRRRRSHAAHAAGVACRRRWRGRGRGGGRA